MFRRVTQNVKTETAAVESPSRSDGKEPIYSYRRVMKHQRPHPPIKDIEKNKKEPLDHLQVI